MRYLSDTIRRISHYIIRHKWQTALCLLLMAFLFSLPRPLFQVSYSSSIYASDGTLLGARIADDGQWRFQESDSVPHKFALCMRLFEDEYFFWHPGVNPVSMVRALTQNIKSGSVVSGGSTLTMQVVRLSRPKPRTIVNKFMEMIQALRLELTHSKADILSLYASHAPFGGNVVGLEAASWRYYGRAPHQLSWSESALLAVLPNSPSMIHPGKNRHKLKAKRDSLLQKLYLNGHIPIDDYQLALEEALPEGVLPLPNDASHLLQRVSALHPGERILTTIDRFVQERAVEKVNAFHSVYRQNEIYNIAALVMETESGRVLAYVGNATGDLKDRGKGYSVDIIQSSRSTGSLLKPFLFAVSLHEGMILPNMLLPDIPTFYGDYRPENYSHTFDGAVPAGQALSRSLNVPMVRLLHDFGTDRMVNFLRLMGLKEINRSASHYGLSLILGGAESSLWSLTGAYATMGRLLSGYDRHRGSVLVSDIHEPNLLLTDGISERFQPLTDIDAPSLWHTLTALTSVKRPDEESGWEQFAGGRQIAWKTGTSFGFRDAWAIGVTPQYTVGVWVGNATGEGRPGIIGGQVAAPVMFDLFRLLPASDWFSTPYDDMKEIVVCRNSGYRAGVWCNETDTLLIGEGSLRALACPWHRQVHLSEDEKFQVDASCYDIEKVVHSTWFVLPPVYEWYFKSRHPWYRPLPQFMEGCGSTSATMAFIQPEEGSRIYLPVNHQGDIQPLVVSAAHRNANAVLYWYLDSEYAGTTQIVHQLELMPDPGSHTITITDQWGSIIVRRFSCVGRDGK